MRSGYPLVLFTTVTFLYLWVCAVVEFIWGGCKILDLVL